MAGAAGAQEQPRYDHERLTDFVTVIFQRLGMPETLAGQNARILVDADLRGIDSHGVPRLPTYARALHAGQIDPSATPRLVHETAATARADGQNGFGLTNAVWAMQLAIEKARATGVGFVALAGTNHFGAASYYALQALPHNLIGLALTNAGANVLPTFGQAPMLGTNPIAVAVPTGTAQPFVLDIATSAVAWGKVEIARRDEKPIPTGWAVDAAGTPTNDPFAARYLLPLGSQRELGSQKGYGLGLLVEILCGPLSGAALSFEQRQYRPEPGMISTRPSNIGQFFGAWDPAAFRPVEDYRADIDRLLDALRATSPLPGAPQVFIPGDPEFAAEADRRERGIPLHPRVVESLQTLAAEYEVPFIDAR